MKKNEKIIFAIQYLLDEGFIEIGYKNGEPAVFLSTDIKDAQAAIHSKLNSHSSKIGEK